MTSLPNRAASHLLLDTYDEATLRQSAEKCRAEMGGSSDIALVFATADYQPYLSEVAEIIQLYGHVAKIVGCSTTGVIGTNAEHDDRSGISMMFMKLPRTEIEVLDITDQDGGFGTDHEGDPVPALALLHPFKLNPQLWLRDWNSLFPAVACLGGLASGTWQDQGIFLFTEAGPSSAAGLLVKFKGGVRIEGVVSQGCRPIGQPVMVTGAQENLVTSLSGRPAWTVLNEAVHELLKEGVEVMPGCIHAGLAVAEHDDPDLRQGDFLIRNIIGGDQKSGIVQLGALPDIGQTLQFQFRDKDTASDDLRKQLDWLKLNGEGNPLAGVLFSCAGRGQGFFGLPNHDAGLIGEVFGPLPLAGFFAAGEIGPVGVSSYLHGYTASAAVFYDA